MSSLANGFFVLLSDDVFITRRRQIMAVERFK